jgi:cholesterol transport system auxiliary component
MKNAMNSVACYAYKTRARSLFLIILFSLTGCALPRSPVRATVYDFGPGSLTLPASPPAPRAPLGPLVIGEIEANPALDSTAILYRLAYANAQQLRPYAQARWSMTPAQLLRQRLRAYLGQSRALLSPGDSTLNTATTHTLRIELEEFSQLFEAPNQSVGLLRLRATLSQPSPSGEKWLAQHSVLVQRPATSTDAAGGVRALTAATDAAVQEIEQWLQGLAL